jgi:hypothetical protein
MYMRSSVRYHQPSNEWHFGLHFFVSFVIFPYCGSLRLLRQIFGSPTGSIARRFPMPSTEERLSV